MFLKYLCPACNRYVEIGDDVPVEDARCLHCGGKVQRSQAVGRTTESPTLPGYVKWIFISGVILLAGGFYFANDLVLFCAGALVGVVIYFLPSLLAWQREHRNFPALLALNAFLGWSILGWVAALIWAMYREKK